MEQKLKHLASSLELFFLRLNWTQKDLQSQIKKFELEKQRLSQNNSSKHSLQACQAHLDEAETNLKAISARAAQTFLEIDALEKYFLGKHPLPHFAKIYLKEQQNAP